MKSWGVGLGRKLIHHGSCRKEFKPQFVGTDYFTFFHEPCREKPPYRGHAQVTHILIDNQGRIIFNLECRICGAVDALKTYPYLWIRPKPKTLPFTKIFHLSPKLKPCIKSHGWDNL